MVNILINLSGRSNAGPAFALELARGLADNQYTVYAVVAEGAKNLTDWQHDPRFKKVLIIKTYHSMKDVLAKTAAFLLKDKTKVRRAFDGITFDAVINPIFHMWSDVTAKQVCARRVITVCHDPVMHSGENAVKQYLYKRHIRSSDELIILTKSFIPLAARNYGFSPEHIHFMPHGLFSQYRSEQNRKIPCRYSDKNINFLFFGRIQKYKGIHVLLNAFHALNAIYSNITLTIAGKGDLHADLDVLGANITFVDRYIPNDEVGTFFDGPNVIAVLPYLDATQSGIIPIAMEYGVPVIASDTGGLREQLGNGNFGIFSKAGDAACLKEQMARFLNENMLYPEQKAKMLAAAEKLQWKRIVADYLGFLKNS